MKQKQTGLSRAEAWFLAAGGMALVLTVGLALWFSPPLYPSSDSPRQTVSQQTLEELSRVDLNTAGLEELCTLPGVGESLAQAILDLRERRGSFARVEDLIRVDGITRKMISQWVEQGIVYLS